MCSRRHGAGRVRSTTPAEDRYIVISAKKKHAHHSSAGGKSVSCGLRKADLPRNCCQTFEGRRTIRTQTVACVPLNRQHRTARFQWCREHHNWTEQDWACVLFSDESRFSLSSDCRRQLIWRESGTAYRPENIQEKDRYPTCSIMMWAGIMINGRTRLHVVANGTMTGQRYIDEVLLPHVRLFRGAVGDKFFFYGRQRNMSSNTRCSGLSRKRGSGISIIKSGRKRNEKIGGSVKCGKTCPAFMTSIRKQQQEAIKITVEYQSVHAGREMEVDKLDLHGDDRRNF
ncbi:transposable element Tcb2 transposase [Trichonephila clavipes]|nr:transposable element Tcb2 transposase [Trichonephila clavipes]